MTARLVGRFEHDSPEWHAARADGIGGSEIAAVLGLSPYESRFSLWHRKAGTAGPQEQNTEMEWGTRLEDPIAGKFADNHPEFATRRAGTYVHERRDWQRSNPDRLLTRPRGRKPLALLEIKAVLASQRFEWGSGDEDVPIYYRTQVMWYLDVHGLDLGYVAVLIGGSEYREYRIAYNVAEAAELRDAAREFLDSIAAGQAPDIDAHGQTYQVIRELHPDIDGTDVEIDPDLAEDYIDANLSRAYQEGVERQTRSLIADAMGSAQRAVCNGHTIATRQARNGGKPFVVAARKFPDPTDLRSAVA